MKRCVIIGGAAIHDYPAVRKYLKEGDFIICCDSGLSHCASLAVTPDLIIGDFDSSPRPDTELPVYAHPVMKDDTDTMLAVRHAVGKGIGRIFICCALGGRFDHAFANIQTLAFAAKSGAVAHILSEDTRITVFPGGRFAFPRRAGWSFSCFSLSERCTGVSIKGAKFECDGSELTNHFPIGVSNVWAEDEIAISFDTGILMVIESRLRSGEHI